MNEKLKPAHKICEKNVDLPTIFFVDKKRGEGVVRVTSVQWFGEAGKRFPQKSQFLFEIMLSPDEELLWWDHPEWFDVVFLGQIRNWPNSVVAQWIADDIGGGNLNRWVVWVCNHNVQMRYSNGSGPQSFLAKLVYWETLMLGLLLPNHTKIWIFSIQKEEGIKNQNSFNNRVNACI